LISKARYLVYRTLFKMEYIYLYATPHLLTWLDRRLAKVRLERVFAGREKFEGYRIWIKTNLSDFIQETLLNPEAQYVRFFRRAAVEQMVARHIAGSHNYLHEITKVLTVELIYSSLLKR